MEFIVIWNCLRKREKIFHKFIKIFFWVFLTAIIHTWLIGILLSTGVLARENPVGLGGSLYFDEMLQSTVHMKMCVYAMSIG